MFQGKQTVLDMLRNTVPKPEPTTMKRSAPSLLDADFEDFAPPPPRKHSRPMILSQTINASSPTLSSNSNTVVRSPFAGQISSNSRQQDEVYVP
jgi:hypothetical protein